MDDFSLAKLLHMRQKMKDYLYEGNSFNKLLFYVVVVETCSKGNEIRDARSIKRYSFTSLPQI